MRSLHRRVPLLGPLSAAMAAAAVIVSVLPGSPAALAQEGGRRGEAEAEAALAADIALTAESNGWSIREATTRYESSEAVGRVAARVAREGPESFVGSKVAKDPEDPPTLFIKGIASDRVRAWVEDEDVPIVIKDEQPYSYDELEERQLRVHNALLEAGYDEVATGIGISRAGTIVVGVRETKGLSSRPEDVLRHVPDDLRQSVDLTVHEGSTFSEDLASGGQKTTYTGDNNFCTSGFTVIGPNGPGVVIAQHCYPENRISSSNYVMTFRDGHYGAYGDVGYYTTNTTEIAEFYSATDDRRAVLAVEPIGSLSEGETVCRFGRGSGNRNCSAEIEDVSQACDNLSRMVLMNADVSNPGDSGGPWFHGNRAYGAHHGECGSQSAHDAFSAAARFEAAIDVIVAIYE